MDEKNKFKASSKYFTVAIYTIVTVFIIALIIKALFFWKDSSAIINNFLSTLSPFFIGIIIAFLINPLVNWVYDTVLRKWFKLKKSRAITYLISILISYVVVIAVIVLGLIYIIPEFINSLSLFVSKVPDWVESLIDMVKQFAAKHPDLELNYIIKSLGNLDKYVQESFSKLIPELTSTIVMTGMSILKFVVNLLVAIIVSCYLLIDKKKQARGIKRVIYAFMPKERADTLCRRIRLSVRTFSNFFDGKMIDSLIIGILTFVVMLIIGLFGVPGFTNCALLIGIIVGITNMIPYFGPFLGGIPSALFLCIYSLNSGLIFAVLIIIIQQLDGNFIGPKILGESTGIRPLWVIFAITIGGWIGGIFGMFLGVPVVAVITSIMEEIVDERLTKKGIDMPIIKAEKIRNPDSDKKNDKPKQAKKKK